jgi:hypothetical protein
MKWQAAISISAFLSICCLLGNQESAAYPERWPPFPAGESAPYPMLKAEPVVGYNARFSPFEEAPVRIRTSPRQDGYGRVTEVLVSGRRIFDTQTAHPDARFEFGSRVFYVDLTGDGLKDIMIYSYPGMVGLGSQEEIADLLIQRQDGSFRHATFEAIYADHADFVDVNRDGRFEMLWSYYYFEGNHSYWVYRVVEITDDGLRLNDALLADFPKIIWFTEKPNDQPTQRLTMSERQHLISQSTTRWQETYR